MKKLFGLLLTVMLVLTAGIVFGQTDSTATTGGDGIGSLLTVDRISGILSALGVIGWLVYRLKLVKTALNEIIVAAEDGAVSESEFQKIVASIKAIWGKQPAK